MRPRTSARDKARRPAVVEPAKDDGEAADERARVELEAGDRELADRRAKTKSGSTR
jgi:hypothetical protein